MAEELEFNVRGLRYKAKAWGHKDAQPVLAVHGWLDNAGSFDKLAPLMERCRIVAIDLAGHGLSAHFPPQVGYNIWSDLPELVLIMDALNWKRCHLLGHSRGATVCTLLAAVAPERVLSLSLIDGLMPLELVDEDPAVQLRNFVQDNIKNTQSKIPTYESVEEAMNARVKRQQYIRAEVMRPIVMRGLKKQGKRWTWSNDARAIGASAFKLGKREKQSMLRAVKCPALILLADKGMGFSSEIVEKQLDLCSTISHKLLASHHHLHLDTLATDVATLCDAHIQQHALH